MFLLRITSLKYTNHHLYLERWICDWNFWSPLLVSQLVSQSTNTGWVPTLCQGKRWLKANMLLLFLIPESYLISASTLRRILLLWAGHLKIKNLEPWKRALIVHWSILCFQAGICSRVHWGSCANCQLSQLREAQVKKALRLCKACFAHFSLDILVLGKLSVTIY